MHLLKFLLVFLLFCCCAVNAKSNVIDDYVISDYVDYNQTKETEDLQIRSKRQIVFESNNNDFNISTETQQLEKELDEEVEKQGLYTRSKRIVQGFTDDDTGLIFSIHAQERMTERGITLSKVKEVFIKARNRNTNGLKDITRNTADAKGNRLYKLMDFNINKVLNGQDVDGYFYQIVVSQKKVVITTMVNDLSVRRMTRNGKPIIVITAVDNRNLLNSNVLNAELTEAKLRNCLSSRRTRPGQL